jgi:hypothetical protein
MHFASLMRGDTFRNDCAVEIARGTRGAGGVEVGDAIASGIETPSAHHRIEPAPDGFHKRKVLSGTVRRLLLAGEAAKHAG